MNEPMPSAVQEQIDEADKNRRASDLLRIANMVERQKRLKPILEYARFVGISDDIPLDTKTIFNTAVANFEGEKGTFSLIMDNTQPLKLKQGQDYMVGFVPMMLHEHTSDTSKAFLFSALGRPSPIFGEIVSAAKTEKLDPQTYGLNS